jgi:hypothetical protein
LPRAYYANEQGNEERWRECATARRPHTSSPDKLTANLILHAISTNRKPTRFGSSNLHQRDPRSALFEGYTGSGASTNRNASASPSHGYGYGYPSATTSTTGGYRAATPNSRGQYSGAVLDELESQNDAQVEGIMGKVKMLKEVSVISGRTKGERMELG